MPSFPISPWITSKGVLRHSHPDPPMVPDLLQGAFFSASASNHAAEIKRFLDIDENKKLLIAISLGYPDEKAKLNAYRSLKLKPDQFTKWCE